VNGLIARAAQLDAGGERYALVTVVSVVRPASTRRGDRALVTPDGRLEGWVGGACSEPIVVEESLAALADGRHRLVRICPPGSAGDVPEDVVVRESRCASEGSVEVLVEPCLPAPLLAVSGDSPAAVTLGRLAGEIGWRVTSEIDGGADAVVVASMGRGDEDALVAALETSARYVGLIASARRASSVLASLRARGIPEESLARVHSPAGLDLGASRQEEIAVAILAQLVAWRHASEAPDAPPAPGQVEGSCCHEA
jgi:xanthine dehydrogenase accessory factor